MLLVVSLTLIASIISGIAHILNSRNLAIASVVVMSGSALYSVCLVAGVDFSQITDLYHFSFVKILEFIQIYEYSVYLGLRVDSLSVLWTCTTSILCACTCIYALGYMKHSSRFLAYNNLFSVCMILFIASNNLLQLYIGWELITIMSYVMINYYHKTKDDYKETAFKIFVLHKLGDVILLGGVLLIFAYYGTFEFVYLTNITILGIKSSDLIFCIIFVSAAIKSAQFGFMSWLKEAMIAPTPASAFLHAATIISAGVFLCIRLLVILNVSEIIKLCIALYCMCTALIGGIRACGEYDIKKILAWSTCSKASLMLVACCFNHYVAAVVYFIVHAFAKCVLFFCAGNISNALSNERDIRKMGGLMEALPKTYTLTLLASLLFLGAIPTSVGFYDILNRSADVYNIIISIGLFMTELLSIICIVRMINYVFHGNTHVDEKAFGYMSENNLLLVWATAVLITLNFAVRIYSYIATHNVLEHETVIYYITHLAIITGCALLYKKYDIESTISRIANLKVKTYSASFEHLKRKLLRLQTIIDNAAFTKGYLSLLILSKRIIKWENTDNVCLLIGGVFIFVIMVDMVGGFKWLQIIF